MDKVERIKMVKAMEFIVRHCNDEHDMIDWLTIGVADGDIEWGDLSVTREDEESGAFEYYIEDVNFADLMDTFLHTMYSALENEGGLYCDGVVDKAEEL